jgi:hypothetical protein
MYRIYVATYIPKRGLTNKYLNRKKFSRFYFILKTKKTMLSLIYLRRKVSK